MERLKIRKICYDAFHISKQPRFFLTLIMSMLLLLANADNLCPFSCACFENTETVTCLNVNMEDVPSDFPLWVQTLTVSGNNITTLIGNAFTTNGTSLELLSTLSLSDNNIQNIEASAFERLPNLKALDLSKNHLTYISSDAFRGLRELRNLSLNSCLTKSAVIQLSSALASDSLGKLKRLELSANHIKSIPPLIFDSFNLEVLILTNNSIQSVEREVVNKWLENKKMHVYLEFNPFVCDCTLESLYLWVKNSSQCPDASRLRCSEPESVKGTLVMRLKKEEVDCRNPDLETVSYVFLGIVLALIGVIFLMVLYLNREGIKRWLNNIREACRDQMEVYHYSLSASGTIECEILNGAVSFSGLDYCIYRTVNVTWCCWNSHVWIEFKMK
ncbi:trophoblast glycoprotein-like [Lepisosteus oculatus]|uniref:trophoblast glycoprotein-like n=1 Tax=Lepisosteus oculatus TaxID=7918 RepID=UPI00371C83EF